MKAMLLNLLVVATVFAASIGTSTNVQAAIVPFQCTQVTVVTWDPHNGGLYITCSNTGTQLKSAVGLCATQNTTINDVRLFESMALSALSAGKGLTSNCENACGAGVCFLGSLNINK